MYVGREGIQKRFRSIKFVQVNNAINQKAATKVLAFLSPDPQDQVLNCYCGYGNFSLPLASRVHLVLGIDGVKSLVGQAPENASQVGIKTAGFEIRDLDS